MFLLLLPKVPITLYHANAPCGQQVVCEIWQTRLKKRKSNNNFSLKNVSERYFLLRQKKAKKDSDIISL